MPQGRRDIKSDTGMHHAPPAVAFAETNILTNTHPAQALPSLAGLSITSIGDVPLPLLPHQEKKIKSSKVSQLLDDDCWQNTWSIDASKLTVGRVRLRRPSLALLLTRQCLRARTPRGRRRWKVW